MIKPRHRLAVDAPLAAGATVTLEGNPAHYLSHVLRLKVGEAVAVFNRTDGEWQAEILEVRKKSVVLGVTQCLRPPSAPNDFHLTVCFAPIKGGRLETIIEKATELGASVLQPVITARTIVDKVNIARADAIAREAAEQCERIDWPAIREPLTLAQLLDHWPADVPLLYGDETGGGVPITHLLRHPREGGDLVSSQAPAAREIPAFAGMTKNEWAVLTGPEGGFTAQERAQLKRLRAAVGVGLGPRILRADTAIISLCALTLAAWGDWHLSPRLLDS